MRLCHSEYEKYLFRLSTFYQSDANTESKEDFLIVYKWISHPATNNPTSVSHQPSLDY